MGLQYRASLKNRQVENVGDRVYELIQLLGMDTVQELADRCMIEPGSIRRLKANKKNVPSFEFLARLCITIPNLNLNWLISGYGPPLVDWDNIHYGEALHDLKRKVHRTTQMMEELAGSLTKQITDTQDELAFIPSEWSAQKINELKEMNGTINRFEKFKGLGRLQLACIAHLEKGCFIKKNMRTYYLMKNEKNIIEQINYTIVISLEARGFLKKESDTKWRYNGKLL